jgi:hypothetical protein
VFERTRFLRYALRFERAFKTDDWRAVRRSFADDAEYVVHGIPPGMPYAAETRGADAIVALFKRMLDEIDRRYDRRTARPASWLHVRDGELVVRWRARYVRGSDEAMLDGESRCRFAGPLIARIADTLNPDEAARWYELAQRTNT